MINICFTGLLIFFSYINLYFQDNFFESNQSVKATKDLEISSLKTDNPVVSPQDILFLVKHNQSPNVVVYQANRLKSQNLDDKKPIDVFWLMNTKGKTTENLTMIEWKLAFGFKLSTVVKGKKYKISLNAIEGRDISIVENDNNKVEGFMNLNGKNCKLKSVFIQFEHSFYIPDVKYVEISGNEITSGKLITERIVAD